MKRVLHVFVGDEGPRVGTLHYDLQGAREHASFTYDETWLANTDRYPLGPTLPLVSGAQFHKKRPNGSVFHPAIADTEPDGWGQRVIMRDHAKRRQKARRENIAPDKLALNAVDYLLAVDDSSRVGALRFRDEAGQFQRAYEPGRRAAPPLVELHHLTSAARAVETESETQADLAYLRGRATSLGGLRPKCTVLDDDGSLAIGKFPSVNDERAVTKGEVLAMKLAMLAGITAAQSRLVDSDSVPVALIRRFDRSPDGRRRMYVSAATLVGAEADDPEEHTYTEIVEALRIYGAEFKKDTEELWRRIAFSILITNVDDHLHNHGFLYAQSGLWRLSPAFDLNPFPDRARELKTWISPETGPEATIDALKSVTAYFGISTSRSKEILSETATAVARWREIGKRLGMTPQELESFAEAFEHSERTEAIM